jgi:hypothetical protein
VSTKLGQVHLTALALLFLGTATAHAAGRAAQAGTDRPQRLRRGDAERHGKAFYDEFGKRYGIKVVVTSPVDLVKLRAMVQLERRVGLTSAAPRPGSQPADKTVNLGTRASLLPGLRRFPNRRRRASPHRPEECCP